MSQQELLRKAAQELEAASVPYMVTGSVASSLQGEPRATHDLDIVVSLDASAVPRFVSAFPWPDFYVDEQSIRDAIRQQGMFNVLHVPGGDKIDFWMLTEEPFDKARFERRAVEEFQGIRFVVSSPEDTILAKLRWAKLSGGSEKQFTDALRVYEVQRAALDTGYLDRWASELRVNDLWGRLKREAEPL